VIGAAGNLALSQSANLPNRPINAAFSDWRASLVAAGIHKNPCDIWPCVALSSAVSWLLWWQPAEAVLVDNDRRHDMRALKTLWFLGLFLAPVGAAYALDGQTATACADISRIDGYCACFSSCTGKFWCVPVNDGGHTCLGRGFCKDCGGPGTIGGGLRPFASRR
jgi:hypothetical protein